MYRKVNTKARGVHHNFGGKSKWDRNTKESRKKGGSNGTMGRREQRGLDYTPLYKFLLSRVGRDWNETHSEALSRLDKQGAKEAIFGMVAQNAASEEPVVRMGESSYYSGLFVDDENTLQRVDPELTVADLYPSCPCCTHTFNGEPYTNKFGEDETT